VNHRAPAGKRPFILVAALATAALSMAALVGPVLANDLHQTPPIAWDTPNDDENACNDANLEPGQVLWHFVHTGTDGADLPSTLYAKFDSAGDVEADGYSNGGGNAIVMYDVITGQDTLLEAYDSIEDDNLLNLSHICVGEEQSQSEEESSTPEESVAEGTGTPAESIPDGAMEFGGSNPLPTIAFGLVLLASLSGLALANVKAFRSK
jgi:hypothetical protein